MVLLLGVCDRSVALEKCINTVEIAVLFQILEFLKSHAH